MLDMQVAEHKVVEHARLAAKSQFSYYHQVMAASNNVKPSSTSRAAPEKKVSEPKSEKKK